VPFQLRSFYATTPARRLLLEGHERRRILVLVVRGREHHGHEEIEQVAVLAEHAAVREHAAVGDRPRQLGMLLDLALDEADQRPGGAFVVGEALGPEADERSETQLPPQGQGLLRPVHDPHDVRHRASTDVV